MTAYDVLALAAGCVGISAAVLFFAFWRIATRTIRADRRRQARRTRVRREHERLTAVELRPGAPVARPHTSLPAGQTVVLPMQPAPRQRPSGRVNGSL